MLASNFLTSALLLPIFVIHVWAYITYVVPSQPLNGPVAPPGSPMPMPVLWQPSDTVYTLNPSDFDMSSNMGSCDIVSQNMDRYRSYIFIDYLNGHADGSLPRLKGVRLTIDSTATCEKYIAFGSNESYSILIDKDVDAYAQITSSTIWGALRGLETFSQIVWQDNQNAYMINKTSVEDYPRYYHRGALIDSARHFQPLSVLLSNLDAMQFNKLNVFHWHLSDDQSFPYESKTFANLSGLGAYSKYHVYSQDDVAEVIEYARVRGIRVIPEFDSPGHTKAIGNAFPTLLTACYGNGTAYTPQIGNYSESENFDPTNEDVYDFMNALLTEVRSVFPDPYVHIGLDEVSFGCWQSNPFIEEFMYNNSIETYADLEGYYSEKLVNIVSNMGYKYVAWQDPIENGVTFPNKTDVLIQVWKDTHLDSSMAPWQNYTAMVAREGYNIIFSSCWYLNYINYGPDWQDLYVCDPENFYGTEEEKQLIVGGEAAMWSEYVDGTNLLSRFWPRASAVSERLWSRPTVNDPDEAMYRLDQQRCRMLRRGIPTQPILDGYCGYYEWGMNQYVKENGSVRNSANIFIVTIVIVLGLKYFAEKER